MSKTKKIQECDKYLNECINKLYRDLAHDIRKQYVSTNWSSTMFAKRMPERWEFKKKIFSMVKVKENENNNHSSFLDFYKEYKKSILAASKNIDIKETDDLITKRQEDEFEVRRLNWIKSMENNKHSKVVSNILDTEKEKIVERLNVAYQVKNLISNGSAKEAKAILLENKDLYIGKEEDKGFFEKILLWLGIKNSSHKFFDRIIEAADKEEVNAINFTRNP